MMFHLKVLFFYCYCCEISHLQTIITQINHAIGASGVVSQECKTVVDQYGKTILEMLLAEVHVHIMFTISFADLWQIFYLGITNAYESCCPESIFNFCFCCRASYRHNLKKSVHKLASVFLMELGA